MDQIIFLSNLKTNNVIRIIIVPVTSNAPISEKREKEKSIERGRTD
jgi:hypothetical protein